MKRFVFFALSIFAAVVALMMANDMLNRYLIFSSSSSNPYKMYRLFANPEKDEIPILGSSRAEAGFAPLEISGRAFNYGLSGSSFRETVFHLKAVLAREGERVVIVNLDPWGLKNGNFVGKYAFAANYRLVQEETKISIPLIDRIPGLRCQGTTRANFAQYMNNRLAVTKTMERGAILERLSRTEQEWEYIISKCLESSFSCNQETRSILEEILTSDNKDKVVFVIAPISAPWLERFLGLEELEAFKTWLEGFANVYVIDFLQDEYPLSDFMDLTHLNENGARRFSRELKARLEALSLL